VTLLKLYFGSLQRNCRDCFLEFVAVELPVGVKAVHHISILEIKNKTMQFFSKVGSHAEHGRRDLGVFL